jgi:hypothetical protein
MSYPHTGRFVGVRFWTGFWLGILTGIIFGSALTTAILMFVAHA